MEKIDQILESLYDRVIEPMEAKEQLLVLFAVSVSAELKPQHCCGLMGFNSMLGDTCPACKAER